MERSRIEWTDHTFNPWRGCTKVSPGCEHCYAETLSKRNPAVLGVWGRGQPRVRAIEATWRQPLRWNGQGVCIACGAHQSWNCRQAHRLPDGSVCGKGDGNVFTQSFRRPRVFCASLADWLDDEVPIGWLVNLLFLIYQTPNLDWQLLTKRPQNWTPRLAAAIEAHYRQPKVWTKDHVWFRQWMIDWSNVNKGPTHPLVQPPHNVWIGVTVEDQTRADERVPLLLAIPARVRFLSCEPLLGEVNLVSRSQVRDVHYKTITGTDWLGPEEPKIHLVICGGESGDGARPMHPEWARSLQDQCAIADTAFFFKQWGEWKPVCEGGDDWINACYRSRRKAREYEDQGVLDELYGRRCLVETTVLHLNGTRHTVGDEGAFLQGKQAMMMMRVGKKVAGRQLLGREWNEMPQSRAEEAR